MKISDETLLAYVDNELDEATRAEVDAAIASDPELARRVDQQRSLRKLLGAAYDPVLEEPVPPRLVKAAQAAPRARIVELAAARKKRLDAAEPVRRPAWGWAAWGGMAASLLVGIVAGRMVAFPGDDVTTAGGHLVARGELARALSVQLAATQAADAPVRVATSYLAKSGDYCRSFVLVRSQSAGVACRQDSQWVLGVLTPVRAEAGAAGGLRMAGSPMPPEVLRAIDEQSQTPLDARAEQSALQSGWRAPGR